MSKLKLAPIEVGCLLEYHVAKPTVLLLNIACAKTEHQEVVSESLRVSPSIEAVPCQIGHAKNRFHRLVVPPGLLKIEYDAIVRLNAVMESTKSVEQLDYALLPAEVLIYLNQSRYCESDKLTDYAEQLFGDLPANFDRVNAICEWTYQQLKYAPGSTNLYTTACDVLIQRKGVCRDFAHIAISFCRALGVPARYISGYACRLKPQDFHGFFEAYLGDRWYLFDATRLAPPAGLVRIGAGRDAADAAFATIWGDAELTSMNVWAKETKENDHLMSEVDHLGFSTA